MKIISTRTVLAFGSLTLFAALATSAVGCTPPKSPYMAPSSHATLETKSDAATVVFVRPSFYAAAVKVLVIDGKGRFLGESIAQSYFTVQMPPGEHVLIASTDTQAAVKATLAPNKIYFVEVHANEGAFSPRFQLLAVTPRSKDYGRLDEWMAKSEALSPDEKAGQEYLAKEGGVDRDIAKANEKLAHYTPEELAERTILADDGKVGTAGAAEPAPASPSSTPEGAAPATSAPASAPGAAPASSAPATPAAKP